MMPARLRDAMAETLRGWETDLPDVWRVALGPVGDNFDRDVLCGLRAGIGGNILMEAKGTYDMPYDLGVKPDAIVPSPRQLLALLEQSQKDLMA